MRILAADDEILALEMLTEAIREAKNSAEIHSFSQTDELLEYAEATSCDVAFLDINMRGMNGVELAKRLKDISPEINIIFVTGYDEYASEAMSMHASGYILKPVTAKKITKELNDLRYPIVEKTGALLKVKCFGNFDVCTPSGEVIKFERSKSKEAFAYLICKHGTSHTNKEIAAALFEDTEYDKKQQGYIQKVLSSMVSTLKTANAEAVIQRKYNSLSLNTDLIDCDYYRFEQLDVSAINLYKGEFMSQYSWAEFITGYLTDIYIKKR